MNDRAPVSLRLLNDFQRDFPLVSRPYAHIAAQFGIDEATVIAAYRDGLSSGVVSRIGAVFAPMRLGSSTLAAMAVPKDVLDTVAALVSAHTCVNHNYEREGVWNLWFVITAPDTATRAATLAAIETETGLTVLTMPLVEEYHIDLGFDLFAQRDTVRQANAATTPACALPGLEMQLLAALQEGLSLSSQPYAELGAHAGISEAMALEIIGGWLRDGLVKRLGVIVRHRELGYTANAMCVWDIPDDRVAELGRQLATVPGVTLCYRRQRALPAWPYNLYCMIHGKHCTEVLSLVRAEAARIGLDSFPAKLLFSRRCFKQCGSRYAAGGKSS